MTLSPGRHTEQDRQGGLERARPGIVAPSSQAAALRTPAAAGRKTIMIVPDGC